MTTLAHIKTGSTTAMMQLKQFFIWRYTTITYSLTFIFLQ